MWVERPEPIIIPESMGSGLTQMIADPCVIVDGSGFRLWANYNELNRVRVALWESSDGDTWDLSAWPVLIEGQDWDRTNAECPSVVVDPDLPEGHPRKYRMYYTGLDQDVEALPLGQLITVKMIYGIGLAFSADGRWFERLPLAESPLGREGLVLAPDDPALGKTGDFLYVTDPYVLKSHNNWHIWYTTMVRYEETHAFLGIAHAVSCDGISWTKLGLSLAPRPAGWESFPRMPSLGRPTVLSGRRHFLDMYYDAVEPDPNNPLDNTSAGIGYAYSDDGNRFTKSLAPIYQRANMIIGASALYVNGQRRLYYSVAEPDYNRFVLREEREVDVQ